MHMPMHACADQATALAPLAPESRSRCCSVLAPRLLRCRTDSTAYLHRCARGAPTSPAPMANHESTMKTLSTQLRKARARGSGRGISGQCIKGVTTGDFVCTVVLASA